LPSGSEVWLFSKEQKVTISTKLYGAVATLACTGILVGGAAVWYERKLAEELSISTKKTAVKLDLVNATRARAWESVAALRAVFLAADSYDSAGMEAAARQQDVAFKRMGEQIGQIRPLIVTRAGQASLDSFATAYREYGVTSAAYMSLCREHKLGEVLHLTAKLNEFAEAADRTLTELKNQQRELLKESQARAETLNSQSALVTVLMICIMLTGAVVAVIVVRAINRALEVAIGQLSEGAEQVAAAASQVSASSQSLAQVSSEQAASLEETAASSEEIGSMARKNSENSRAANDLMSASKRQFVDTNSLLEKTIRAMEEIAAQGGKISTVIKAIDEIAFQTNILALNAAVEAARAGDAGMGFGVVADEVRSLAQRCARAAKETTELLEESISKSNGGKAKIDCVAAAILETTEASGKVSTLVQEVSTGSEEQARGIEQIGKAISQMEHATQTTAANAEESAAAAEELNAESESLKDLVASLQRMIHG
jgi:methyl-accepting chemotaxis protein